MTCATANIALIQPQLVSFFKAEGVGTVPIGIMPNGLMNYGEAGSSPFLPRPMVDIEVKEITRIAGSQSLDFHEVGMRQQDAVEVQTTGEQFLRVWSEMRGSIAAMDRLYYVVQRSRAEGLEEVMGEIEGFGFRSAARAMVAERNAEIWMRPQLARMDEGMDSLGSAAADWLNFYTAENPQGAFGRHILSRAIAESIFSERWQTADQAFMHSAEFYVRHRRFGDAVFESLRAAHAHTLRRHPSMAMVSKYVDMAMLNLEFVYPRPDSLALSVKGLFESARLALLDS